MKSNRLQIVALSLAVAALFLTGSAMAGTTTFTALKYAREVGAANLVYTIPTATTVDHTMNVVRTVGQDFFVDVALDGGAKWATDPGAITMVIANGGAGAATFTQLTAVNGGVSSVRYLAHVTTDFANLPTLTLTVTGTVRDAANVLGGGGTINITISSSDSSNNVGFDQGSGDTKAFLTGIYAVTIDPALTAGSAVIDVASNRLKFVGNTLIDDSASLGIKVAACNAQNGTAYALLPGSKINLLITGDLSAIDTISWNGVDATEASGVATIAVTGDNGGITGTAIDVVITVDGTTTLQTRALSIAANLVLSGGVDGPAANSRTLLGASTLTTWSLNGTVLTAVWTNGNIGAFNGRMYIWNPSAIAGGVVAQIYTLPVGLGGSTLVATVNLGSLPATSGTNVRLAEDLLTPAGITLPYTTNGGNLLVVFTINAPQCVGVSNVFSPSFSFGVTPLAITQNVF